MGRKKYFTEEERKAAKRVQDKRWKDSHKEERKKYNEQYYNTLTGRAKQMIHHYVRADKLANRIGDELPKDYIDVEWVMEQIQNGCTYKDVCGTTDWRKTGLNRIDVTLPHTKTNCEPCCWDCNKRIEYERKKKLIDQIDCVTGEVIASFPSVNDAAKFINDNHSNISSCCSGKRLTVKGYIWKRLMM